MILLVVDTQRGDFTKELFEFDRVRNNIKTLITEAFYDLLTSTRRTIYR